MPMARARRWRCGRHRAPSGCRRSLRSRLPSSCVRRQAAVLEDHFAGGAGAQAQLVLLLAGAEAGRALVHDEGRDAVLRGGAIGDRHGHADVGVVRVGGEGLGAVEHPVAVFAARPWCACRRRPNRLRARSATSSRAIRPMPAWECTCGAARRCPSYKCDCEQSEVWAATMMPTEPSTRDSSSMMMEYSM